MAQHNEVGRIGEEIAKRFLKKKGLAIVERNYRKPYGEIDIVARENGTLCFVEVKTVSYETGAPNDPVVSRETGYRPEENVHPQKLKRLARVIQAYLFSHGTESEKWRFDVIAVYLDQKTRRAKVKWLKDIIIE